MAYAAGVERKRYIPDIVGPRYAVRVEDLGPEHVLHVQCDRCRRVVLIEAAELRRRAEGYERLVQLAERLRCGTCAAPGSIAWSIYRRE
jgi:hypothetical protein